MTHFKKDFKRKNQHPSVLALSRIYISFIPLCLTRLLTEYHTFLVVKTKRLDTKLT